MTREHSYTLDLTWTGNTGTGTSSYRGYERAHEVTAAGPGLLAGSADPSFRGDPSRWNPEQLLVASLAQCHLLWYLALAAKAGVVVTEYSDAPVGIMEEQGDGSGQFTSVTLHPRVRVAAGNDAQIAHDLHGRVGDFCFISRSVSFPVLHAPVVTVEDD